MTRVEASERRSGRKRKPNSKYFDALLDEDLGQLGEDAITVPEMELAEESPDDDEYILNETFDGSNGVAEADEEDEDDVASHSASSEEPSLSVRTEGRDRNSNVDFIIESSREESTHPQVKAKKWTSEDKSQQLRQKENESRSTGLFPYNRSKALDWNLSYLFGSNAKHTMSMLQVRDKWFDEITLPSRRPDENGIGGMAQSFWMTDAERRTKAEHNWKWYFTGGSDRIDKLQTTEEINEQIMDRSSLNGPPLSVVLGPISDQSLFQVIYKEPLNLDSAWQNEFLNSNSLSSDTKSGYDRGWLLNLGGQISHVEWAPNQKSSTQFLAILVSPCSSLMQQASTGPSEGQACLQIWKFSARSSNQPGVSHLDMERIPELRLQLWFNHERLRAFKWCPEPRPETFSNQINDQTFSNLLATLDITGHVRVYNIRFPHTSSSSMSTNIRINQAAFTSHAPNAVFMCICWISSHVLAAGTSNGRVAVWDLSKNLSGTSSSQATTNAKPLFYIQVHFSHILTITNCHPSHPDMIATTCIDGTARLTDLRAPSSDFVDAQRNRLPTRNVVWYEPMQHFLLGEHADGLRSSNIRTFGTVASVIKQTSAISTMASSPIHAAVLVCGMDGEVKVANPIRKMVGTRVTADYSEQRILQHTWRRGRPPVRSPSVTNDLAASSSPEYRPDHDIDFPNGLVRLITGFTIEDARDRRAREEREWPDPTITRPQGKTVTEDQYTRFHPKFGTIHEEPTSITSAAWNPNEIAGGWAAVGMGSGLVWIGDLCWD